MKIYFDGDIEELKNGIEQMTCTLDYTVSDEEDADIRVTAEKDESHAVTFRIGGKTIHITYGKPVYFYRGLARSLYSFRIGGVAESVEDSNFDMDGIMVDCSRCGVLSVKGAEEMLRYMACMGLDMMMLYTEDTYEIPEYPYFGYLRGRFSKDEIREIDAYARNLGIELIPCIQTAAHLSNALKWSWASGIKDMGDSLLEGEEKTYEFIEAAVKSCADCFTTDKIHIGYDEAVSVGRGQHLDRYGFEKRTVILKRHLDRIKEILKKYDRKPMMWGDMYMGMYEEDGVVETDGMGVVYWDYYQPDEKSYLDNIDKYRKISDDIIFAGGSWTWGTLIAPYFKTYSSTIPALRCCLDRKVRRVFVTMWGDDGQETSWFAALPGLQMYAEFRFCRDKDDVTETLIGERFRECLGGELDMFKEMARIDMLKEDKAFYDAPANPTKAILFENPVFGQFDKDLEGLGNEFALTEHFNEYAEKMKAYKENGNRFSWLFEFPEELCRVSAKKWNIGLRLKAAHDAGDKEELSRLTEELGEICGLIKKAREAHRKQWFRTNKAQGWDNMDLKYGSVICQTDTGIMRLKQYISGEIDGLEELASERLPFYCKPIDNNILGVTHYALFGTSAL